jgi:putative ABC transport system substrate-binding protein
MRRLSATVPILLVVLLVFASAAATQPAPRVARIGMLCAPSCNVSPNDVFLDELRKLGWVEHTTIVIERKDPQNRLFTPPVVRAAKNATSDIPIVMLFVANPVALGFASSLARPGANLSGVATLVPGDFNGKQLGILREALPQAAKLGFQLDLFEVREVGKCLAPLPPPVKWFRTIPNLESFIERSVHRPVPAAPCGDRGSDSRAL